METGADPAGEGRRWRARLAKTRAACVTLCAFGLAFSTANPAYAAYWGYGAYEGGGYGYWNYDPEPDLIAPGRPRCARRLHSLPRCLGGRLGYRGPARHQPGRGYRPHNQHRRACLSLLLGLEERRHQGRHPGPRVGCRSQRYYRSPPRLQGRHRMKHTLLSRVWMPGRTSASYGGVPSSPRRRPHPWPGPRADTWAGPRLLSRPARGESRERRRHRSDRQPGLRRRPDGGRAADLWASYCWGNAPWLHTGACGAGSAAAAAAPAGCPFSVRRGRPLLPPGVSRLRVSGRVACECAGAPGRGRLEAMAGTVAGTAPGRVTTRCSDGTTTRAVVPPAGFSCRVIDVPCRWAVFAAASRPIFPSRTGRSPRSRPAWPAGDTSSPGPAGSSASRGLRP
jgi:hypothetical protein